MVGRGVKVGAGVKVEVDVAEGKGVIVAVAVGVAEGEGVAVDVWVRVTEGTIVADGEIVVAVVVVGKLAAGKGLSVS